MSLTTIVWASLYVIAIVGALANPIYALFGYLLEYYQRPALYWWGRELPDLRWNFTIAAVAGAAYLLRRQSLEAPRRTTWVPLVLLIVQALNTSLVTLWAIAPDLSWKWSVQYWKLVITYFLFSGIVRTARGLDLVILFQIIGTAYWGWDALDERRFSSRLEGVGSGDTLNANQLAGHILTIIPLAVVFVLMKGQLWMRVVAAIGLPYIVNLLILCNSRGATVGFAVAGAVSILLVRRGMRRHVFFGAAVAGLALYLLADEQFINRQQTTVGPRDNSAQSRVDIWNAGLRVIADYPFGTGGRGFHLLSPRYLSEIQENDAEGRSAHNTVIQVTVEWGIQGLILFVLLLGYTFVLLHRVRRERTSPDRVYFTGLGLQLGLIATLAAAFFSNRFFGESIYWLCGLSTALYCMTSKDAESERTLERVEPAAA